MSLATNFCVSISLLVITITCLFISADNYVQANEHDVESISKIGQGVGHIMNIYYWYVALPY